MPVLKGNVGPDGKGVGSDGACQPGRFGNHGVIGPIVRRYPSDVRALTVVAGDYIRTRVLFLHRQGYAGGGAVVQGEGVFHSSSALERKVVEVIYRTYSSGHGVTEADQRSLFRCFAVPVAEGRAGDDFDGVGAYPVSDLSGSTYGDIVDTGVWRNPFQILGYTVASRLGYSVRPFNNDGYASGVAQLNLDIIFHAAFGRE